MTGFIGVGQLKYILTNLGEKMTDEEVDELLKAVDTSSGQVNYTGTYMSGTALLLLIGANMAQILSELSLPTKISSRASMGAGVWRRRNCYIHPQYEKRHRHSHHMARLGG